MISKDWKARGMLAAVAAVALACSGTQLNDVGDVTTGGGSAPLGAAGSPGAGSGSGGVPISGGGPSEPDPGISGDPGGAGGESGGAGGTSPAGGTGGGEPSECGEGDNLLRNGSFEGTGLGFPSEWRRYGTPAEAVIWDHNVAVDGSSSVKMVMPTSYEYWSEQRIDAGCVAEGELLRVTGQYRSNRANTDIELALLVGDEFYSLPIPGEVDVWIPFSIQLNAPPPPFRVGVWSVGPYNDPATTLWVDDVAVERVP